MDIQKIMILPICLGIFLAGVMIIPYAFAGCGPGTVLVDGVCELVPIQESNIGCGPGTVLVDGVCELDQKSGSTSMSIEPLYVIIVVVAIGGVIGAIFAVRKGSKPTIPSEKRDVEKHESKYLTKKSTRTKETIDSCQSCGTLFKPAARFCGECGTARS